jgi:hypothetical protein
MVEERYCCLIEPTTISENKHVVEARVSVGEYSFRLKRAPMTGIRVKLWRTDDERPGFGYEYTMSHAFHGPKQIDPYNSSAPGGDTEEEAIQKAIEDLPVSCPKVKSRKSGLFRIQTSSGVWPLLRETHGAGARALLPPKADGGYLEPVGLENRRLRFRANNKDQ